MPEKEGRQEELLQGMRHTVRKHGLFQTGQIVVVAVSGGPDSVALLHALSQMSQEADWALRLVAAHLHHGIRGAEADDDAAYVQTLCRQLAIPCFVERVDVPALKREQHLSLQETARGVRHAFLRRVAAETGAERIALGHTRDDRIETVLLNLLRGTGLEGLSGFPAADFPLVRPFYDTTRAETLRYCEQRHLAPRHDSSNAKNDYRRNRVRAELLPNLAAYYNQRIDAAILRIAELSSADNEALEQVVTTRLPELVRRQSKDEVVLDGAALCVLHPALQRRALRQVIAQVRGHLQNVVFERIETALQALRMGERGVWMLPSQGVATVYLASNGQDMRIYRAPESATADSWSMPLPVPGEVVLPTGDLLIAEVVPAATWRNASLQDMGVTVFDLEAVELPLTVRSWRAGDRMRPARMRGSKKLQDLFTDAKIPSVSRTRFPVLEAADGRIMAVLGLRRSEFALDWADWELPAQANVLILRWLLAFSEAPGKQDAEFVCRRDRGVL